MYRVPATPLRVQQEIKRSKFITHVQNTRSKEDAEAFIRNVKNEFADARHNCWAYVAGNPNGGAILGMSDDGEPKGTAGKPMLSVLQHKGIGDITVVVTRYFGGIKLGTGGLVRAYSSSVQQALDELELVEYIEYIPQDIGFEFSLENTVRHYLEQNQVQISRVEYTHQVQFTIELEEGRKELVEKELGETTQRRVYFF